MLPNDSNINRLTLSRGAVEFPTLNLPKSTGLPRAVRESYIVAGNGYDPVLARVWMKKSDFLANGALLRSGSLKLTLSSSTYGWPYSSIDPLTFRDVEFPPIFNLLRVDANFPGVNEDIVEVVLVSQAYLLQKSTDIQSDINLLTPDKKDLLVTPILTYPEAAVVAGSTIGLTLGAGAVFDERFQGFIGVLYSPLNLRCRNRSSRSILRRLCRSAGVQMVPKLFSSTGPVGVSDFRFKRIGLEPTDSLLDDLWTYAGTEGGKSFPSDGLQILPEKLRVLFPTTTGSDTPIHVTIPYDASLLSRVRTNYFETVYAGEHFDVAGKTYTDVLNDIANWKAYLAAVRLPMSYRSYVFAGGYPINPDGTARKVRWSISDDGVFTTVDVHGFFESRETEDYGETQAPMFPDYESANSTIYLRDDGAVNIESGGAVSPSPAAPQNYFLGRITASSLLPGAVGGGISHRRRYSFVKVKLDAGFSPTTETGELWNVTYADVTGSEALSGDCISLPELAIGSQPSSPTPYYIHGQDANGPSLRNTTIRPRPLGGGGLDMAHKVPLIVMIFPEKKEYTVFMGRGIKTEYRTWYWTPAGGAFDGQC